MDIPESEEELELFVTEKIPENRKLEYKKKLPSSGKNKDLAKDLSAMANAEGGLLIYGIAEDDQGRADDLIPFELEDSPERINLVAQNNIDGPVSLEEVKEIYSNDGEGYLVVKVPKSERTPHVINGAVWGRDTKGNKPLTRRDIGELFVESEGFVEEFNLTTTEPGRIRPSIHKEPRPDSTGLNYYLILENDGNHPVKNVNFKWSEEENQNTPDLVTDQNFPIDNFPPNHSVRLSLAVSVSSSNSFEGITEWKNENGEEVIKRWPLTL